MLMATKCPQPLGETFSRHGGTMLGVDRKGFRAPRALPTCLSPHPLPGIRAAPGLEQRFRDLEKDVSCVQMGKPQATKGKRSQTKPQGAFASGHVWETHGQGQSAARWPKGPLGHLSKVLLSKPPHCYSE